MQAISKASHVLRTCARKLGPYLLLEIVLPGGTLFALLLFLYRNSSLRLNLPAAFGSQR